MMWLTKAGGPTPTLILLLGTVSGVLGQTMAGEQDKLIGVIVGGVVGAVLLILLIVILYFLCRPNRDKQHHQQLMDHSYGTSSSATPTRVDKYQHLPPGVWTSNPSLVPIVPPQPGLTRYPAFPTPSPHLQLQPNLHNSQSSLNVSAGQQDDMVQHMNITDGTSRLPRQVGGQETVTARVFSEHGPVSKNLVQSAPTVAASNSALHDVPDTTHGSRHVLSARLYSDLPPSGHQVKRTNSRTVHDYVPSILGGAGVSQQQGGPLERGAPSTQPKDPRHRFTREQQLVPGQLPAGVSRNGGTRGIFLRRSPSEAAVYASIPIMTSRVNESPYDNFVLRPADAASQSTNVGSNPVRRSHSNVSSVYVPEPLRYQTNRVTAYSTSDIYAIPNKVSRTTQNATKQEIIEETSSITIMGAGSDSPLPPPLPPAPVSSLLTTTKATPTPYGQVHRTVRGTASLTLGPEEEDDYEEIGGEDSPEEVEPAGGQQEALEEDVEADVEERLEAELLEAEVVEAEVLDTEVLEAEVVEAEVLDTEVLEAEVLEDQTALPPGVQTENPPGGGKVPGGLKGPDLTRHLPEFDNTDIEEAHSAFKFLDQYSLCRESLSQHSLRYDSPSQQSSMSFSAGRVYMLSAEDANSTETVLDFSYLQAKGKHIADEAFRFLDELDDGDDASR